MRILIDIGHPAHVHLFKNFAWEMQKKSHYIFFTCREKEFETYLLEQYGFKFKSFGRKFFSRAGKIFGLIKFDLKELLSGIRFKPDIFLSHGSMYAAHAAFLLGKPHVSFEDTGNLEQVRLYLPFTRCVITSDVFPSNYGEKQVRIRAHNELAYLHPNHYHPDLLFKKKIGLKPGEDYILLRFVAWNATHDTGESGITDHVKYQLVSKLSEKYKLLISSECPLQQEFEKFRISFAPDQIHDALYHTKLLISEGTTMAMEAAILGTPSIYINSLQYNNVTDMEKYGLLYNLYNEDHLIEKVLNIASDVELKNHLQERRRKMLEDKIDPTAFLVWFIENWPDSLRIMKENPEYQERFR